MLKQLTKVPKLRKPKLLRSNPHRKLSLVNGIDTEVDDEDLCVSRSYPRLKDEDGEDDIGDDVRWKLFLARQLALLMHQQKWGV